LANSVGIKVGSAFSFQYLLSVGVPFFAAEQCSVPRASSLPFASFLLIGVTK
jgi:hypothetical protein